MTKDEWFRIVLSECYRLTGNVHDLNIVINELYLDKLSDHSIDDIVAIKVDKDVNKIIIYNCYKMKYTYEADSMEWIEVDAVSL